MKTTDKHTHSPRSLSALSSIFRWMFMKMNTKTQTANDKRPKNRLRAARIYRFACYENVRSHDENTQTHRDMLSALFFFSNGFYWTSANDWAHCLFFFLKLHTTQRCKSHSKNICVSCFVFFSPIHCDDRCSFFWWFFIKCVEMKRWVCLCVRTNGMSERENEWMNGFYFYDHQISKCKQKSKAIDTTHWPRNAMMQYDRGMRANSNTPHFCVATFFLYYF